jgi:hypothetical protein
LQLSFPTERSEERESINAMFAIKKIWIPARGFAASGMTGEIGCSFGHGFRAHRLRDAPE